MKCYICGLKAAARANGKHYLCKEHANQMAAQVLRQGGLVVMARKGTPQYLLVPELLAVGASNQNLN